MRRTFLSLVMVLSLAALAAAEESGFSVEPGAGIRDVLAKQGGKSVTLRLRGGEEIGGRVQSVGDALVHLTQLTGRDFSDAAIRLEAIDAVVVRVRTQ